MSPAWSWALAAASLLGSELIARRHRAGWLVQLAGQIAWMAYGTLTGQWGFVAAACVFGPQNTLAWLRWGHPDHLGPLARWRIRRRARRAFTDSTLAGWEFEPITPGPHEGAPWTTPLGGGHTYIEVPGGVIQIFRRLSHAEAQQIREAWANTWPEDR